MKRRFARMPPSFARLGFLIAPGLALGLALTMPPAARADVPSLQVAPLQYESTLTPGRIANGFIDVSNPSDTSVTIVSSVQGFRQTGHDGDLEFYDDADLAAAIKPGLDNFTLGPRESVRVVFSVDAAKLPAGGAYAAIFFRTVPPEQTGSGSSFIAESANVGTLLILTNGTGAQYHGSISQLRAPLWQFGQSLTGSFGFTNTDTSAHPVGFKPRLSVRVMPWGYRQATNTGLVLPGITRTFSFNRAGAFLGIVPLTVTDATTQSHATVWVVACTGWYRPAVIITGCCVLALAVRRRRNQRPPADDQAAESSR